MSRLFLSVFLLLLSIGLAAERAQAHDLPAQMPVTGFFDHSGNQPEFVVRVPLIMLTNLNLPKRGPGYLDLDRIEEGQALAESAVVKAFGIVANGEVLAPERMDSKFSLTSERTFETRESATASILGPPLPVSQNLFWNQGFFDVRILLPEQPVDTDFALRTELPDGMAERTLVSLTITGPDGGSRMLSITGAQQEIALDPAWYQAGSLFLTKGVEHILIGTDHLLFLLCLILPLLRQPRMLLGVVTAFTVGHSLTLIPAALGFAPAAHWFIPLVEVLIAASILYMAIENVLGLGFRFRWRLAFGFGLIHGFGFASTLSDVMQFAGSHLVTSLIFFNIGIEMGQVLVLAVAVPVLAVLLRSASLERTGTIVISVLVGHQALHWVQDRTGDLPSGFGSVSWFYPAMTITSAGLVLAVIVWLGMSAAGRRRHQTSRAR